MIIVTINIESDLISSEHPCSSGTVQEDASSDEEDSGPPVAKRQALATSDCNEIASFVGCTFLSAESKYNLVRNQFKPSIDFAFPKSSNGRTFQYRWLMQFPWLVYSKEESGGFCLPCVLFASSGYRGSDPGVLVNRPLTVFTKALEILRKHTEKGYNKQAVVGCEEFMQMMRHEQPDIRSRLSQTLKDRVASNRQKLSSIFKTVVFCGQQNIPLHGHRDNATDVERDLLQMENHGNFRALLDFRVDAGDMILGEHLATAPRNATYTSSVIQNQVIDVVADQVRQKIITKIQAAKWFTVIADEVTDVSNKEQLSLVVRYVDHNTLSVREDLLGFFECDTGITGRALADKVTMCLQAYGLDLSNLRGQAYDGAGNMAGPTSGTAALIAADYSLALYLHCSSHCLNLAVVKSLQITSVRNMMGVVGRVFQFFAAHPKRQRALEKTIDEVNPESRVRKLKDLCRTRWVQRIDAMQVFCSLHQSVVVCMESIRSDGPQLWSTDSLTDARSLQLAVTTTDFVCALVITNSCVKYLQVLTSNLQAESRYCSRCTGDKHLDNNSRERKRECHNSPFTLVQCGGEDVH